MKALSRNPYSQLVADALLDEEPVLAALPREAHQGFERPSLAGISILGKLGRGGFGAVYLGYHSRLDKAVAVKVLFPALLSKHPEVAGRFLREARLAAQVSSPHLVAVLDVDVRDGVHYLVMEYIAGQSAGAYLQARVPAGLPEATALEICIAAAKGLGAAHERGIIHRDVKPENILIPCGPDGQLRFHEAKLADLGLARPQEYGQTLTEDGTSMGTPGYMAPEQVKDARSVQKSADVFSLGASLYMLLSNQLPWRGTTPMSTAVMTVNEPHVPLQTLRPDVSQGTRQLVDQCLDKVAKRRPQDGAAVLRALIACRAALPVSTQAVDDTLPLGVQAPGERPAAKSSGEDRRNVADESAGKRSIRHKFRLLLALGPLKLMVTFGAVLLALVCGFLKYEYDKGKAQELAVAERSRREREARDRESAMLMAERERDQREAVEAKGKELAKERMALEEQRRLARQKAEEERLAQIEAQKVKAHEAALEEQRKKLQAEREAAAKKVPPPAEHNPAAGPPKKTFVLKDGRKIVALKVVEFPQEYSVKTEDGKFVIIPKDSIDKIIEE